MSLYPSLLHGVVKAAQQELMLEELNSEGMRAIDLNHKLSLKLLDKVWCGSVRGFYGVELDLFLEDSCSHRPGDHECMAGSWVHVLNEVRRRRGCRSSQRVLMPACSKLLRKS